MAFQVRSQAGCEDKELDNWDAGLNQGLVFRPKAQKPYEEKEVYQGQPKKEKGYERYPGPARPAYYEESNMAIVLVKAIAKAFVAIVPYFTILDSLSNQKEFTPCNDVTCHYMRMFDSAEIPATGVNVIGVQNGLGRPLALHYASFDAYTCDKGGEKRVFSSQIFGKKSVACPSALKKKSYSKFLDNHDALEKKVERETKYGARNFTGSLRFSFAINKAPLAIFAWPMNLIAKLNPHWGMENIPNSRCPGKTFDQMQEICAKKGKENVALKSGDDEIIINHLRKWGPSKIGTALGLVGYGLFTALHDLYLLIGMRWPQKVSAEKGQFEMNSLTLGFIATASSGIAAICVFFWAMGAAEVFVAPASDHKDGVQHCACFYQIPELSSLVALSTPFAVFAFFMARVQMQGLAALFGDFLAFQTYYIPHYLGQQSYMWTWGCLCSPKMAGTIQGKPRVAGRDEGTAEPEHAWNPYSKEQWSKLRAQQTFLFWLSVLLQFIVALVGSTFMISFKELCVSLYRRDCMPPLVQIGIKYILMPAPAVVALAVGGIAAVDWSLVTIFPDEGESFRGQVSTVMECFGRCLPEGLEPAGPNGKLVRSAKDKCLGRVMFVLGESILLAWTLSTFQGLCPDLNFLLGHEELVIPKVAQAELWASSGFIFFFVHIPRVMAIVFSTWEDLESLKYLEVPVAHRKVKDHNGSGLYVAVEAAES